MAITRTPIVDDSGTGTDGTVLGNAWKQELYDQIDAALAAVAIPAIQGRICDGRLTLTSGTPVTTSDVTGATSIYFTPYGGNGIDLYSSGAWSTLAFTEITLALGTVTSGACYDIFAYNNSGAVAVEKLIWTTTTTRATALTTQDGVLVKSGDATRRYLGTFYSTSTTTTEDSVTKRYLWNYYHRRRRPFLRQETTATWTYTTATVRQANANAANQVECVIGVQDTVIYIKATGMAANSTGGVALQVTIGEDATSSGVAGHLFYAVQAGGVANETFPLFAELVKLPAVGRHYYALEEYSGATGTTTWYGNGYGTGLSGWVEA